MSLEAIQYQAGPPARLRLLDQLLLPLSSEYVDIADVAAAWNAIKV